MFADSRLCPSPLPSLSQKQPGGDQSPPQKLTKLAIGVEGGAHSALDVKWRTETNLRTWPSGEPVVATEKMNAAVAAVLRVQDTGTKEEAKSWEKRIHPCEHTLTLQQDELAASRPVQATCSQCDLKAPL